MKKEDFIAWVRRHFRSWDAYEASLPASQWLQSKRGYYLAAN